MTDNIAIEQIKTDVEVNDVVLFMKGTPMFPQCGFSAAVVQILSQLNVKFKGVNVLESDDLRQGHPLLKPVASVGLEPRTKPWAASCLVGGQNVW